MRRSGGMGKRRAWCAVSVVVLGIVALPGAALPSSHREAPAIVADPLADNTDNYAWVDANGNLVIIANFIGLEQPDGGPNWARFSDDVLYEIHITRGPTSLADAITYRIRFQSTPFPKVDPADLTKPVGGGKEFFSQLGGQTPTHTLTKGATRITTHLL